MSLVDIQKADFERGPLRDHGVKRKFRPGNGQMERTITVLEDLGNPDGIQGFPNATAPVATVTVLNDAFKGVPRKTLDTAVAYIEVKIRGVLEFRPIAQVIEDRSNEAVLVLEVR